MLGSDEDGETGLLRRAAEGDGDAFGQLFEAYRPRLELIVVFRLGPRLRRRLDPEDIVQETFLKAMNLHAGCRWDDGRAFLAWLRRIADHVIAGMVRKHKSVSLEAEIPSERSDPGDGYGDRQDGRSVTPERAMRRNERFDRLAAALEKLSPERRQVILYSTYGVPAKEIGRRMGRSTAAVAVLLHRALRQLRGRMCETATLSLPADRSLWTAADGA